MNRTTATLIDTSPRAGDWQRIFGRLHDIPLQGPLPRAAHFPGKGDSYVYLLDLSAITADERQRLIEHIAGRFNLSHDDVERDLDVQGVPILDEDVIVTIPLGLALSMMPDFDDEADDDEAEY